MSYNPNLRVFIREAVERIRGAQLTIEYAGWNESGSPALVKVAESAQNYRSPAPTTYPYFFNYMGGGQIQISESDSDYFREDYQIIMRYIIAPATAGYAGNEESRLFEIVPAVVGYFNAYPDMVYPGVIDPATDAAYVAPIGELIPDGVLCQQVTRLGTFNDDRTNLGVEFSLSLPFHTERQKTFNW